MSRWIAGALIGAAAGAVIYASGGRNSYARRGIRAARRMHRSTFLLYPAVQWAIVGAIVGAASNVAQGAPALNGLPP